MSQDMPRFKISDEQLDSIIFGYCNDLTRKVGEGKVDPVIGRDKEIGQVVDSLVQRGRANVALLGGAGVGKTAMFSGLALALATQPMPAMLKGARVVELDFAAMAAGTENRSEFEGRVIPLIKGVAERNAIKGYPKIILCMDELHTTVRSSQASSAAGIADVMKPYLTEGSLRVVGATTEVEYNQYWRTDAALHRRFKRIYLREPDLEETVKILQGLRGGYERHYDIRIPDSAIEKIVQLAQHYIRGQNNPDKSIGLLDAAGAYFIRHHPSGGDLDNASVVEALAREVNLPSNAIE